MPAHVADGCLVPAGPTAKVVVYGKNEFAVMQHPDAPGCPWHRGAPVPPRLNRRAPPLQPLIRTLTQRLVEDNASPADGARNARRARRNSGGAALAGTQEHAAAPSCPVCFDTLSQDVWALRCGHCFHSECLLDACRQRPECPLCRAHIRSSEDVRKIFMT